MDKYFEFRYYSMITFVWFCVIVIIVSAIVWLIVKIFGFLKKKVIDSFMKKQGYVLKRKYHASAWYDGDVAIEFQNSLYNKKIKEVKSKYRKESDNN